jgi:hypothetical protein
MSKDRASFIVTALLHIIANALQNDALRQQLEDLLRDEIADIERQVAADRETP